MNNNLKNLLGGIIGMVNTLEHLSVGDSTTDYGRRQMLDQVRDLIEHIPNATMSTLIQYIHDAKCKFLDKKSLTDDDLGMVRTLAQIEQYAISEVVDPVSRTMHTTKSSERVDD